MGWIIAGIYINMALLVFSLIFFYQNMVAKKKLAEMYEDIFKFRRELIKLASKANPRRRF